MSTKRFRVAFSFSGEKRDYVAHVAAILVNRFGESAILYDKYHEAEFARSDLSPYLNKIYRSESDLVVVVASPDSEQRQWAGLEWAAIRDHVMKHSEYNVMLCRFMGAQFQGLPSTAGFVELDHKSPSQTAALILERLALNEGKPRDYYTGAVSPKREVAGIPNNLPQLPHFFGRDRELKVIGNSLDVEARTWGVLIDGPGGIGKTSLAIRAAQLSPAGRFHRILFLTTKESEMLGDGQRRLTDSVLPGYLEMLNGIARLLDQPELMKSSEDERVKLILNALVPARALLILDNLESLRSEHRDQLFNFLSRLPLGCKAIVTSRRRTDIDARVIRLEKLDRDAALAYLGELASDQPILREASDDERIQLYEETGGSPLFMRWIAAQLGKGRCGTIQAALKFLRSAPPSNDPLEFAFGDLLETLTINETRVLAVLTYFTSPIKVRHIAELSALSNTATQTALEDLANRALVVADAEQKTFALTPLVPDFLRKARPEVVTETGNRLEKRAYALIVENGYNQHDRFPVLDAAWPTVAPALPLFLAGPNQRLQTVCDALSAFLDFTGRWDESLSLNQQAEARAVAAGDNDKAGWRAYGAGAVQNQRQQAEEVLDCADRAAAYWQAAKAGPRERAIAIELLGLGHRLKEDYPAAITAFQEVLALDRSLSPESEDVAIALNWLADTARLSGDFPAAERDYREALRVALLVGDVEGVAIYTGNLATLARDRDDWAEAETLAREALPLSEKIGRQELIAVDCHSLAEALLRQDKATEALAYARRAVEIYAKLGSPDLADAQATLAKCEEAMPG